jgi:hypothetical protein
MCELFTHPLRVALVGGGVRGTECRKKNSGTRAAHPILLDLITLIIIFEN